MVTADRRSRRSRLPAAKLAEYDLALLNREFVTRLHIDAYFREQGVGPRILLEANSIHAVIEAVQLTDLATILPDGIAREHARLRAVALDPPLPTRIAVLLCRENAYRTAATRAFCGLAQDWNAAQPGPLPNSCPPFAPDIRGSSPGPTWPQALRKWATGPKAAQRARHSE